MTDESITITGKHICTHVGVKDNPGPYSAGKAYWVEAVMCEGKADLITSLPPVFCVSTVGGPTFVSSCGQTMTIGKDGVEYSIEYRKGDDTHRVLTDMMEDCKGLVRAYVMDAHIRISSRECVGRAQTGGRFKKDVEVINGHVIDNDFTLSFKVKDLAGFVANGVTEEAKE